MPVQNLFILSEQAMKKVVDQIQDDQWGLKLSPELFPGKEDKTLRDIINYHAYDDAWVPDVLDGKTIAEVGDKYDGDLLGDDPKASYAKINATSQATAKAFTDLDKTVHLSYGDFSAREYFLHIIVYRAFQAWSIARFIGVDETLDPELVQGLWDEVVPHVEEWRQMGVFGPVVEVPANADQQTKLLALTGFWREKA